MADSEAERAALKQVSVPCVCLSMPSLSPADQLKTFLEWQRLKAAVHYTVGELALELGEGTFST